MKDPYRKNGASTPKGSKTSRSSGSAHESDLTERMRKISQKYLPRDRQPVTSMHTVAAEMFSAKRDSVVEICSDAGYVFGTGFFLSNGMIASNAHVVVTLENGKPRIIDGLLAKHRNQFYRLKVIDMELQQDVALLAFDGKAPQDLDKLANRLGNSHGLLPGDEVITVGSALGYGLTYNKFSVKDRARHMDEPAFAGYREILLLNGTAQHGNSGGPLYNINGEVVGILTGSPNTPERVMLELPEQEAVSATLLSPEAGICYAVTAETLRALLL